jgi:hypothetical protein
VGPDRHSFDGPSHDWGYSFDLASEWIARAHDLAAVAISAVPHDYAHDAIVVVDRVVLRTRNLLKLG